METSQKNTSVTEVLDPGNVIRCLNCLYETDDISIDKCPNCDLPVGVVYVGTQHGEGCRECTQIKVDIIPGRREETYGVDDERLGFYMFDVAKARRALHSVPDTQAVELPPEFVAQLLYVNVTEPRHYSHIPDDKIDEPGILCELELGNGYKTYVLIDGSHRAAMKVMAHKPFYAFYIPSRVAQQFIMARSVGTIVNEPPAER